MIRRSLVLALAALCGALTACGTTDLVKDEAGAQKDRVKTIIKDPAGAVDQAAENELRRRGVDGSAPPIAPGQ